MRFEEIVGTPEGEMVEFKREVDNRGGYLEAVVAFLNTKGGAIYFGVDEIDGRASAIRGITDPNHAANRLHDTIADRIDPKPAIERARPLVGPGGEVVLELGVPRSQDGPHAVRDGARHAVYVRVADRNRPLSWAEIVALQARTLHGVKNRRDGLAAAIAKARAEFLSRRDRTTLRVACWGSPKLPDLVDVRDRAVQEALAEASSVGVRESGWNFLSSSGLRSSPGAIETGRVESATTYRHLRVTANGRVEFETDRDELWSWHAQGARGFVVDPFVLTEYPVSVLRLAAWLFARGGEPPPEVLIEMIIRNCGGARLGPGRPDHVPYQMGHGWAELQGPDLQVPETAPLVVSGPELVANADRVAFRIVREAYQAWGLAAEDVPFYDAALERFVFPK